MKVMNVQNKLDHPYLVQGDSKDFSSMKIAIIGASGAVGRQMMVELQASSLFENRSHSCGPQIMLFASSRSEGQIHELFGQSYMIQKFDETSLEVFADVDYALVSSGGEFSKRYLKRLAEMGVVVIDNSSAWRLDPQVPLVVPEVNREALDRFSTRSGGIVANPNCSTIQLMVAVAPLERAFGIKTLIASTYQSVSGAGRAGHLELQRSMQRLKINDEGYPCEDSGEDFETFQAPIAANVIPVIGEISSSGISTEEQKMIHESQKILAREDLHVMATAVRVPVFISHSIAVACELTQPVCHKDVIHELAQAPGLVLDEDLWVTPRQAASSRLCYVSRVRLGGEENSSSLSPQRSLSSWVQLWNVADNLKKGAATNAVQILESVVRVRSQTASGQR